MNAICINRTIKSTVNLFNMPVLKLRIRRLDLSVNTYAEEECIECDQNADYDEIKRKIMELCKLDSSVHKIIKLRNSEQMMVTYSMMLKNIDDTYFVDITNVTRALDSGKNIFQDAYINSVCSKLTTMKSRIQQVEKLLPQIECKQNTRLEETIDHLLNKVQFLNHRFDEILPVQWQSKMQYAYT